MADNTQLSAPVGAGGDTIIDEEIPAGSGLKMAVGKIRLGAYGVDGDDVTLQNPFPVRQAPAGTSSTTAVAASTTASTLFTANSARLAATVYNDSSADLYVKLGTGVSTSSFTLKMAPGSYYEIPGNYTGEIDGLWSVATGNARLTELST
jgi:hypothetical protein